MLMIQRWKGLLERLGLRPARGPRTFSFDESLVMDLVELAEQAQVPVQGLATELLTTAIWQQRSNRMLEDRWEKLSGREKDVAAFTCLDYTNRQIAAKLNLSQETVKWYIRQVLVKFDFHSKDELQARLEKWDFSNWGPKAQV